MLIFVSSTFEDMKPYRMKVEETLTRMNQKFIGMEFFGSHPDTPKNVCLQKVAESDIYVGIIGRRYGFIDKETGISMTELEYRKARELNIPILIYLMDDSVQVPPEFQEKNKQGIKK